MANRYKGPQIVLHGVKTHDSWPAVLAGMEGKICQPETEINAVKKVTSREKSS